MPFAILRDTPVEVHHGFAVKREDLSCSEIPLSKMRGILAHLASRPETIIANVDTFRSWNGLCVARSCAELRKTAVLFYPRYKAAPDHVPLPVRLAVERYRATAIPIDASRQGVMVGRARACLRTWSTWGAGRTYLMPQGARLEETSAAVAEQVRRLPHRYSTIVVPTGTGTHLRGVLRAVPAGVTVIAVLGYTQDHSRLARYVGSSNFLIADPGFAYRDTVPLPAPPFDMNPYYETKAWRWMLDHLRPSPGVLFWNIGGTLDEKR